MNDLERIGGRLPYDLPDGGLETLRDRIRRRTTERQNHPAPHRLGAAGRWSLAAACAAAAVVAAVALTGDDQTPSSLETLLATTPIETLRQVAAENYDDIFGDERF